MTKLHRILVFAMGLFLLSCAASKRTAFVPGSGPPTVGMPAELNERERLFIGDLEGALRDNGLLPVRHGGGDMALDFSMKAGPIHTDTAITLLDGRRILASGNGRAAGVPLIGRSAVAEKSFGRAFQDFHGELVALRQRRGWKPSLASSEEPAAVDPVPVD